VTALRSTRVRRVEICQQVVDGRDGEGEEREVTLSRSTVFGTYVTILITAISFEVIINGKHVRLDTAVDPMSTTRAST
jgi:hypothetical protein